MHAIRLHEFGPADNLRWEEVDDPAPRAGEVLVDVTASGVHLLDTSIRRGTSMGPFPLPDLPAIPGREVAGVVAAAGEDVDDAWVGRRVVAHLGQASRGYAERVVTDAARLHVLPDGVSPAAGVAMIGTGRTALGVLDVAEVTERRRRARHRRRGRPRRAARPGRAARRRDGARRGGRRGEGRARPGARRDRAGLPATGLARRREGRDARARRRRRGGRAGGARAAGARRQDRPVRLVLGNADPAHHGGSARAQHHRERRARPAHHRAAAGAGGAGARRGRGGRAHARPRRALHARPRRGGPRGAGDARDGGEGRARALD